MRDIVYHKKILVRIPSFSFVFFKSRQNKVLVCHFSGFSEMQSTQVHTPRTSCNGSTVPGWLVY